MKICVYTYLIGSYDQLLDQPVAADSAADFVCFTDDPQLSSQTWQTQVVEPRYPADLVRSARALKILGHDRLAEYDVLISIDASVLLLKTPEEIVADWLDGEHELALAEHSFRETVLDEFDEVVRLNYDDLGRVHEQLLAYGQHLPESLETRPLWTGLMVRRNTPAVTATMRLWFDHVLRYSRRDQLSINAVLARTALPVSRISLDNFSSPYHRWPAIEGRRISMGKASPYPPGPLLAEVRRAHRRLTELEDHIRSLGAGDLDEIGAELHRLRTDAARAEADRAVAERQAQDADAWRARWYSTQGLRGAAGNLARAAKTAVRRRWR